MTAKAIATKSIRWLYVSAAVFLLIVSVRLFIDFRPQITIEPESAPAIRAPFLSIINIGPIARENWLTKTMRECVSFAAREMEERLSDCAFAYFDIRAQDAFERSIPKTSFGRYMSENPSEAPEVQAINTKGPFLIYEGARNGKPVWRYQSELMTTLFMPGRTATKKWLIDVTITFDTPDAVFFSGFRYLSFYMKELS